MIILVIPFCIFLYLYMIYPGKPRKHPVLETKCFAHRGLHGFDGIPENSMAAFRNAVAYGYGIELDVQLTKDDVMVVHHDYDLKRTCGVNKKIRDLTYRELKRYSLMETKERIPRFADVLALVDGKVPLLVELKMEHCDRKLCRLAAEALDQYRGLYCMESFHPFALFWFRLNRPEVIRGQLSMSFRKDRHRGNQLAFWAEQNLLTNFVAKPDFIAYKYIYWEEPSLRLCRKISGIPVYGWTFRSREEYEKYRRKFYGFIFEKFMI